MKTWIAQAARLRPERHFERPMQCYAERPAGVVQMLEAAAARNPAGEALVCGEVRLTWQALRERVGGGVPPTWQARRERVARAAGALASRGVAPGDRIGLLLGNRAEFPIAF